MSHEHLDAIMLNLPSQLRNQLLPKDLKAEQSLLALLQRHSNLRESVLGWHTDHILNATYFFHPPHKILYKILEDHYRNGEGFGLNVIEETLIKQDLYDTLGGSTAIDDFFHTEA